MEDSRLTLLLKRLMRTLIINVSFGAHSDLNQSHFSPSLTDPSFPFLFPPFAVTLLFFFRLYNYTRYLKRLLTLGESTVYPCNLYNSNGLMILINTKSQRKRTVQYA